MEENPTEEAEKLFLAQEPYKKEKEFPEYNPTAKVFHGFPKFTSFLNRSVTVLKMNELKLLCNYLNILSGTREVMLRRVYSFLHENLDFQKIVDYREEKGDVPCPTFCDINKLNPNASSNQSPPLSPSKQDSESPGSQPSSNKKKRKNEGTPTATKKFARLDIQKISQDTIEREREKEENIKKHVPLEENEDGSPLVDLVSKLMQDQSLLILTGLTPNTFSNIARDAEANHTPLRGPQPHITTKEGLVLYLHFLKTGDCLATICGRFGVKKTTLLSCFARMRKLLNTTLANRQVIVPRPEIPEDRNTGLDNLGLIIGCTTFRTYKPTSSPRDAKKYYDDKCQIYGLKKEVAIQSNSPYRALFISPGSPAGNDNFEIYQKSLKRYIDYLKVTDEDRKNNPNLQSVEYWSLLCDRAYVGDLPKEKEPFTRYSTPRSSNEDFSSTENSNHTKLRGHLESFLGRLIRNWKITTDYRLAEESFDLDIDNCIYLTNEELASGDYTLLAEDGQYYRSYLSSLMNKNDDVSKKRKSIFERNKFINIESVVASQAQQAQASQTTSDVSGENWAHLEPDDEE